MALNPNLSAEQQARYRNHTTESILAVAVPLKGTTTSLVPLDTLLAQLMHEHRDKLGSDIRTARPVVSGTCVVVSNVALELVRKLLNKHIYNA